MLSPPIMTWGNVIIPVAAEFRTPHGVLGEVDLLVRDPPFASSALAMRQ